MSKSIQLPFLTLLLLISFPSVNAVLYTPALPSIAAYFNIADHVAQQTITLFLIGYAIGQLFYGPITNRFGRKKALYLGIGTQIVGSLFCILSRSVFEFNLLMLGRLLVALGSGVGLKMTFTLVNECYPPHIASQKIAYLMPALAVTFGFGVTVGGFLNTYYGWTSCFYAGGLYGCLLLVVVARLSETAPTLDLDALKLKQVLKAYLDQLNHPYLLLGGLLMGLSSCFIYTFSALAPFIAIDRFGMSSAQYGLANLLPATGIVMGSFVSVQLAKQMSYRAVLQLGVGIISFGTVLIGIGMWLQLSILHALFIPMVVIYFGLSFIAPLASSHALSYVEDKAHGSAVMNFINIGLPTVIILALSFVPMHVFTLPILYATLCFFMMLIVVL